MENFSIRLVKNGSLSTVYIVVDGKQHMLIQSVEERGDYTIGPEAIAVTIERGQ